MCRSQRNVVMAWMTFAHVQRDTFLHSCSVLHLARPHARIHRPASSHNANILQTRPMSAITHHDLQCLAKHVASFSPCFLKWTFTLCRCVSRFNPPRPGSCRKFWTFELNLEFKGNAWRSDFKQTVFGIWYTLGFLGFLHFGQLF